MLSLSLPAGPEKARIFVLRPKKYHTRVRTQAVRVFGELYGLDTGSLGVKFLTVT